MKVQDLFKKINLTEERQDSLSYEEVKARNAIDKVILHLSGSDSAVMSRLTTRYRRLDKAAKLLEQQREQANSEMKQTADLLFDATDAVLTRVINTSSYIVTFSKASKGTDKDVINHEAILNELLEMVPELEDKINKLTKKYKTVVTSRDTPSKLIVKAKTDEGLIDKAVDWIKNFVSEILSWASGYDKRLHALEEQLLTMQRSTQRHL